MNKKLSKHDVDGNGRLKLNIKRVLDEVVEDWYSNHDSPMQSIADKLIPVQPMQEPSPNSIPIEYIYKDNAKKPG